MVSLLESLSEYLNNSLYSQLSNGLILAVIWALIANEVFRRRVIWNLLWNPSSFLHKILNQKWIPDKDSYLSKSLAFLLDIVFAIIISFFILIPVFFLLWLIGIISSGL